MSNYLSKYGWTKYQFNNFDFRFPNNNMAEMIWRRKQKQRDEEDGKIGFKISKFNVYVFFNFIPMQIFVFGFSSSHVTYNLSSQISVLPSHQVPHVSLLASTTFFK